MNNTTPTIITPQQGQQVYVYLLYEYTTLGRTVLGLFTNKTQAEAMQRWHSEYAKQHDEPYEYVVVENMTAPHDNHC